MAFYLVRPWEMLIPELASLSFERVVYVLILLTVMGSTGLHGRLDAPTKGLVAFTAAICLSAITADSPSLAWSASAGLYVYLTNLLAFVLIASAVRSVHDLIYVVAFAVLAHSIFAGKALWEYTIHGAGQYSMGVTRLAGINHTFGHPNAVATLLVAVLPWWRLLWRSRDQFTAFWSSMENRLYRWLLWASISMFVIGILLTGSRMGFLGLAAYGCVCWLGASGNRLKVTLVLVVAIVVGLSLLDKEHTQRIRSLWDDSAAVEGGEESKEGRIYAFQAGLRMFEQFPITGVGIGNFGNYRMRYDDGSHLEAHSIPAQLLGETGVIGTAAFIYLVWTLLKSSRQLNRAASVAEDGAARILSDLGTAMRHSICLLLLLGIGGHLAYFFTWVWIAAFLSCALHQQELMAWRR